MQPVMTIDEVHRFPKSDFPHIGFVALAVATGLTIDFLRLPDFPTR
jgi:hypothetical protein